MYGSGLELPTYGWPGPNEGTTITSTDTPWTGNWRPVYQFAGYAYYGVEVIPIDVNPSTQLAAFVDCFTPPGIYQVPGDRRGAMGINMEGIRVGPSTEPSAACCVGEICSIRTQLECDALGGTFLASVTSCDPNPCPQTYTVAPDGSGDFPTIQAALDAASHADTIELTDGVFSGPNNRDLDFHGKAFTVRSQSRNPHACVIDCGGAPNEPHRGFDFHSGEGPGSVLDAVTIRGGCIPPGTEASEGAGLRCSGAAPTILNCVIVACQADNGAAAFCNAASAIFRQCTLAGNSPAGFNGSAVALAGVAAPVFENCIIAFNDLCAAFDCGAAGAPVLSCCDVFGNPRGDWTGCIASQQGVNGNFSADPLFCSLAGGDVHLSCDSPCLAATGCGRIGALPEGCQLYGITSVKDVPNDQGRAVRLRWHRACTDVIGGDPPITQYSLWRRIDEGDQGPAHPDASRATPIGTYPPGEWEYVLSLPACGEATYATIGATVCDSTIAAGQCWSVFFLRAHTAVPTVYFDSQPDSGYSMDNLAPEPPEDLRLVSPTLLAWEESGAGDFDYFSIYGSSSEQFDSTAVLLGRTSGTSFVLPQPPRLCYHVTATDFSGNEGDAASLCDYSVVAANGREPDRFSLGPIQPNPLRRSTRINLEVPQTATVSLRVYDAAGRLVATLVDGVLVAGHHAVEWRRGAQDAPQAPSGIYFVRMRAPGYIERRAVVVLD